MNMNKYNRHDIMQLAWQFVKKNGYSLSDALKTAWRCFKKANLIRVQA